MLLETREDPDEENVETRPRTWLELVGTMTAKARTQRSTLLEKLLAGQGGVDMEVPQVPLWNGQDGELHLIPQRLLDEGVPVRAVQRLIFEVVAESGETS